MVEPNAGDLVSEVRFEDGKIIFNASGKKGNAVIAAKDGTGTIQWSWHIWMTDKPREQVYDNNAGIMMDRNLGATSATPDDITSFGLMYQWGRKDPFRGAGELVSAENGKSSLISTTAKWPDAVVSDKTTGTIEYAVSHPMTFIIENSNNSDWFYTDEWDSDDTRWQPGKTVYDPCPAGWRVPDGGSDGIWARAMGITDDYFESTGGWDTGHSGVDFSKTDKPLATGETVWYPYEGLIYSDSGNLSLVLDLGGYWSVTKRSHYGYVLAMMKYDQAVMPYLDSPRAHGCSVRCMKVRQEPIGEDLPETLHEGLPAPHGGITARSPAVPRRADPAARSPAVPRRADPAACDARRSTPSRPCCHCRHIHKNTQ